MDDKSIIHNKNNQVVITELSDQEIKKISTENSVIINKNALSRLSELSGKKLNLDGGLTTLNHLDLDQSDSSRKAKKLLSSRNETLVKQDSTKVKVSGYFTNQITQTVKPTNPLVLSDMLLNSVKMMNDHPNRFKYDPSVDPLQDPLTSKYIDLKITIHDICGISPITHAMIKGDGMHSGSRLYDNNLQAKVISSYVNIYVSSIAHKEIDPNHCIMLNDIISNDAIKEEFGYEDYVDMDMTDIWSQRIISKTPICQIQPLMGINELSDVSKNISMLYNSNYIFVYDSSSIYIYKIRSNPLIYKLIPVLVSIFNSRATKTITPKDIVMFINNDILGSFHNHLTQSEKDILGLFIEDVEDLDEEDSNLFIEDVVRLLTKLISKEMIRIDILFSDINLMKSYFDLSLDYDKDVVVNRISEKYRNFFKEYRAQGEISYIEEKELCSSIYGFVSSTFDNLEKIKKYYFENDDKDLETLDEAIVNATEKELHDILNEVNLLN